jgi:CheY-like chemotaxis protein
LAADGDPDLHVHADQQRLVQVLLNLLANATNYNRPNGSVVVRFHNDAGRVEIMVEDTGHGIHETPEHRLFQPFERLGESTVDGTGLGLALSRKLMRLMGGELSLIETGENGSVFAVSIASESAPIYTALRVEEGASLLSTCQERVLKIVYIDDNFPNLHLLERVFANFGGIEMIPAMQASIGLQLIFEHLPDLVLLDLHLPDSTGLEVLQQIRANPETRDTPVIVVSADATPNQIKALLQAGANSYLTKPIDLERLFVEVSSVKSAC